MSDHDLDELIGKEPDWMVRCANCDRHMQLKMARNVDGHPYCPICWGPNGV